MAEKNMMVLALVLVVSSAALIVKAQTGCSDIVTRLFPCEPFLLGFAGSPSPQCCLSAQELLQFANQSKEQLRNVCECLKIAASNMPGISLPNAAQLPQLCNLPTNIPISPDTDCNSL